MYVKKQKAKAPSAFSGRMEVKVIGVKNKDQAGGALLFCSVLYTHTHTHTYTHTHRNQCVVEFNPFCRDALIKNLV